MLFHDGSVDDDGEVIRQEIYPFRLEKRGGRAILELPLKLAVATITFGAPAVLLFNLGMPLMPDGWHGVWAVMALLVYLSSLSAALSWRKMASYSRTRDEFEVSSQIFSIRFGKHTWPRHIFKGISFGRMRSDRSGGVPVVRLECCAEGFLADGLFLGDDKQVVSAVAERLSAATGLPLLASRDTGGQHTHDDLRNNPWMVPRMIRSCW